MPFKCDLQRYTAAEATGLLLEDATGAMPVAVGLCTLNSFDP